LILANGSDPDQKPLVLHATQPILAISCVIGSTGAFFGRIFRFNDIQVETLDIIVISSHKIKVLRFLIARSFHSITATLFLVTEGNAHLNELILDLI
jgi:uncharacterized integral membrane protein